MTNANGRKGGRPTLPGEDRNLSDTTAEFAKLTRQDAGTDDIPGLIPEGEIQVVQFRAKPIRQMFHDNEWWFSVIDVVGALSESSNPRRYWSDLKSQLVEKEGFSELYDQIVQLPMPSADGKNYETDAANTETLFRIIQSVKSPKAEGFKRWLAKVGYERIQEIQNPEIAIKRAIMTYQIQGRSNDWIEARIRTIVSRKALTHEWKNRGVDAGKEYAILTSVISKETFGIKTEQHKKVKSLKGGHNLRDHMTDLELILTMLGERSTTEITQKRDAQGFYQNFKASEAGGRIAGDARRSLERELGTKVVSPSNFLAASAKPLRIDSPKAPKTKA